MINDEIKSRIVDFPVYRRSPRLILEVPDKGVEIRKPDKKATIGKTSLVQIIATPLVMLVITILLGVLLKRGIYMIMGVVSTAVTSVFSVYRYISEKKECNIKNAKRDELYTKYLLECRKEIYELRNNENDCNSYNSPKIKEVERMINEYNSRIYERTMDDADFLTLAVGYCRDKSSAPVIFTYDELTVEKDELETEAYLLKQEYENVDDVPIVIDLKKSHLGMVGEKRIIHEQLHVLLAKLVLFQSYHDLEIVLLINSNDRAEFDYMKWYPHFMIEAIGTGGIIDNKAVADQILLSLHKILKDRELVAKENNKEMTFSPHFLFVIDDNRLTMDHVIMECLGKEEKHGFSIIYTSSMQENLPENIGTIVKYKSREQATLVMNEKKVCRKEFDTDVIQEENLEWMSRNLSVLTHEQGLVMHLPENVSFFEMYKVKSPRDFAIEKRWSKAATNKSLAVPLGVRVTGEPLMLNLHEKAHGPHGLVAGTTGSGKSEIIQSYVLSLAVNFSPSDVGFLLIDYKGGGMANLFKNLPHVLGTITNLDADESMRALVSIKSELARRQRIFNDYEVNHINGYTSLYKEGKAKEALPHLFIISDEFAELKKEQPEFMTELVSTARLGRSLGIHLILATQKPTGVVTDQIWSNSRFKLALKVQDESDSKEIIKTADAAYIRNPGRAYLQVGNNEIYELFQSAYSGELCTEEEGKELLDNRVYVRNHLGQMELLNEDLSDAEEEKAKTQLISLVEYIAGIYSASDVKPVKKPWLEPLAVQIISPLVNMNAHKAEGNNIKKKEDADLKVLLGVLDNPACQSQTQYIYDFRTDGNLAVFGASGYGKSTFLSTLILSLAINNKADMLNFYILDMGNGSLMPFKKLPHTADYMTPDDTEKLMRFRQYMNTEIKHRKQLFMEAGAMNYDMYNKISEEKLPAIIYVIDNYDISKDMDPEFDAFVTSIVRDGINEGIYVVLSASRPGILRFGLSGGIKSKIALYMYDKSETTAVVGKAEFGIKEIKGRALIKGETALEMQVYAMADMTDMERYMDSINLLIKDIEYQNENIRIGGIKVMPQKLTLEYLKENVLSDKDSCMIPIGLDYEKLEPVYINLHNGINLIVGVTQSGRTNLLKLILEMSADRLKIFTIDDKSQELVKYSNKANITYVADEESFVRMLDEIKELVNVRKAAYEEAKKLNASLIPKEYYNKCEPVMIMCAGLDEMLLYLNKTGANAQRLLLEAADYNINTIIVTPTNMNRLIDEYSRKLKEISTGIVLGNFASQIVFGSITRIPLDTSEGVGYLCDKGTAVKVKIALCEN